MLCKVEAKIFGLLTHTKWDNGIGDVIEQITSTKGEHTYDDQGQQMVQEKRGLSRDSPTIQGENRGQDHAYNSAQPVAWKYIQRVVQG